MILLWLLIGLSPHTSALKCFSCASSEYQTIFRRSNSLTDTLSFNDYCDSDDGVKGLAPVELCQSSCITVYEPHYIGGLQMPYKPYMYIRGCAEKIFANLENRPAEVDVLHQESICVSLKMSLIYPQVMANEDVKVCSCIDNACNFKTVASSTPPPANIASFLHFSILSIVFMFL